MVWMLGRSVAAAVGALSADRKAQIFLEHAGPGSAPALSGPTLT